MVRLVVVLGFRFVSVGVAAVGAVNGSWCDRVALVGARRGKVDLMR